jgi:hypothetical protein
MTVPPFHQVEFAVRNFSLSSSQDGGFYRCSSRSINSSRVCSTINSMSTSMTRGSTTSQVSTGSVHKPKKRVATNCDDIISTREAVHVRGDAPDSVFHRTSVSSNRHICEDYCVADYTYALLTLPDVYTYRDVSWTVTIISKSARDD